MAIYPFRDFCEFYTRFKSILHCLKYKSTYVGKEEKRHGILKGSRIQYRFCERQKGISVVIFKSTHNAFVTDIKITSCGITLNSFETFILFCLFANQLSPKMKCFLFYITFKFL